MNRFVGRDGGDEAGESFGEFFASISILVFHVFDFQGYE